MWHLFYYFIRWRCYQNKINQRILHLIHLELVIVNLFTNSVKIDHFLLCWFQETWSECHGASRCSPPLQIILHSVHKNNTIPELFTRAISCNFKMVNDTKQLQMCRNYTGRKRDWSGLRFLCKAMISRYPGLKRINLQQTPEDSATWTRCQF